MYCTYKSFSHDWQQSRKTHNIFFFLQRCVWGEHHHLDSRARGGRAKTQSGCSHPADICIHLIFDLDSCLWFQQRGGVFASTTSASLCTSHRCVFFFLSAYLSTFRRSGCCRICLLSLYILFFLFSTFRKNGKPRGNSVNGRNVPAFCKLGKWVTQIPMR